MEEIQLKAFQKSLPSFSSCRLLTESTESILKADDMSIKRPRSAHHMSLVGHFSVVTP